MNRQKVKHVMPDDRSPLELLGGLEPEMEMDDPMLHSEILYCTIERNKKCDNEGQRSEAQPGKIRTRSVRSWGTRHLHDLGYRRVHVLGAVVSEGMGENKRLGAEVYYTTVRYARV
jgi:hypothetical protein